MNVNEINEILTHYCAEIIREPLVYFSEADLQAILYQRLNEAYSKYVDTNYHRGHGSKKLYKTKLVHREYGIKGMLNSRADLVLFSNDDVNKIDSPNLTINNEYITPFAAFELGSEKTTDFQEHIKNDLKKLKELVKLGTKQGYYVHFHKDVTLSRNNTKSRNNTEEKLDKMKKSVEDIFSEEDMDEFKDKIKFLIFIVRVYRKNQERIWGKCEMYCINKEKVKNEWRKVNLNELETQIKQTLEFKY